MSDTKNNDEVDTKNREEFLKHIDRYFKDISGENFLKMNEDFISGGRYVSQQLRHRDLDDIYQILEAYKRPLSPDNVAALNKQSPVVGWTSIWGNAGKKPTVVSEKHSHSPSPSKHNKE